MIKLENHPHLRLLAWLGLGSTRECQGGGNCRRRDKGHHGRVSGQLTVQVIKLFADAVLKVEQGARVEPEYLPIVLENLLHVLLDPLGLLGDGAEEAVEDARVVDQQLQVVEKVGIRGVLERHWGHGDKRGEEGRKGQKEREREEIREGVG